MIARLLTAAFLTAALVLGSVSSVSAQGSARPFKSLYAFGDSLTDTGNAHALSGGSEPPSPPYFDGRFSNGPVWVETLAELLHLNIDFDTTIVDDELANNRAVGGAFTGTRNEDEFRIPTFADTGILSQVASFAAAGGEIGRRDLVIVWGGANDYLTDLPITANPDGVVANLVQAVDELAALGGEVFLVPNLPDLGSLPIRQVLPPGFPVVLNVRVQQHNGALATAMAELGAELGVEIVVLDVNTAFRLLLEGDIFENVTGSCLIQIGGGIRVPSGLCPPDGDTFDATGVLFWDLVHPTTAGHEVIALFAHGALTGAAGTLVAAAE